MIQTNKHICEYVHKQVGGTEWGRASTHRQGSAPSDTEPDFIFCAIFSFVLLVIVLWYLCNLMQHIRRHL